MNLLFFADTTPVQKKSCVEQLLCSTGQVSLSNQTGKKYFFKKNSLNNNGTKNANILTRISFIIMQGKADTPLLMLNPPISKNFSFS